MISASISRLRNAHIACAAASSGALPGDQQPSDALQQQQDFLRLVVPTFFALMLCNMDRICLSVAILPMAKEFGWPEGAPWVAAVAHCC